MKSPSGQISFGWVHQLPHELLEDELAATIIEGHDGSTITPFTAPSSSFTQPSVIL